jgi:hypothetical protein
VSIIVKNKLDKIDYWAQSYKTICKVVYSAKRDLLYKKVNFHHCKNFALKMRVKLKQSYAQISSLAYFEG